MNKQARPLIFIIGGALLITACAPTAINSYTGQDVAAPTRKLIEEARTKADHEALAAYYEREARALHEKAEYYRQMADQYRYRGGANRMFYAPRYEDRAQGYRAAEEENRKKAKRHREFAAQAIE
ncbi:MAG: hypothetical protein ACREXY_27340 [Gammaproteobacteria bacterium]